jgi:hypothetical protein
MTIDKAPLDKAPLDKAKALLEYPQIMENAASHAVSEEAAVKIKEAKPF